MIENDPMVVASPKKTEVSFDSYTPTSQPPRIFIIPSDIEEHIFEPILLGDPTKMEHDLFLYSTKCNAL